MCILKLVMNLMNPLKKKAFSIVLSMFIVAGISLSVIHYHGDNHDDSNEVSIHHVSNDYFHCLICGSVFKADFSTNHNLFTRQLDKTIIPQLSSPLYSSVINGGYNGRAPPAA